MRELTIAGPRTGRPYPAVDTGQRWNGAPVVAFRLDDLVHLIEACDGLDANGEGLVMLDGAPHDLTDGHAEPVDVVAIEAGGRALVLYVPAGRIWDEAAPNRTVNPVRGTDPGRPCPACAAGTGEGDPWQA